MSERVEIPIEGGDFDYDEDQIQELDHFDIGEEEDPEEVTAREAGVWEDAIQRVPLSRQPRKSAPKKPGRKRQGEIIHIPKRQPPRGCAQRVKSYQQYDTFGDDEEDGDEEEDMVEQHDIQEEMVMEEGVEEDDSDPEPLDEDGEPSTSKMFRVFVRKDGSGMHYDWPIYQDSVISLKDVVHIISSEAQGIQKSLICTTIPEEFTNNGTFIIHFEEEESLGKEAICNDGLGTWNSAQMFVRKYIVAEGSGRGRPMMTQKNDHNLKIVCEQFLHPGTDTRGDFIRKIYTGFDKDEHLIPYVVISYEWMGQPHPLTVYEDDTEKQQPFEQMTWKKCSRPDDQVPILARHGCDYNSAVAILLSAEKCTSYGKSVPQYVQECISFVLDVEACGGHRALFMDGNEWQRPSGSHRFFRISYPGGGGGGQNSGNLNNGSGVGSSSSGGGGGGQWSIERCPANFSAANSDIQVLCRRYNGQKYSSAVGFVRKIYQLKILPTCPIDIAAQLVNQNLAIVSYSYRNSAMPTFIEQPPEGGKLPNGELVGEEVEVVNGEVIFDEVLGSEMRQMVEAVELKKKTNEQRLMGILQRIHRLDEICKKEHWPDATAEVQQLMEISTLLEGYIN
ncbi:hypothetical protein CAEBREN_06261 [Caenorhabditis brenneri]|uniref:Uncharacterized protein n=1 Tax=Caenorhabditis brenneri TaxID=135651 RepID=G0P6L5_CAEBE|nr:hypothetical protein CAEBREN_06261 [Caenorhabditis brenneri]